MMVGERLIFQEETLALAAVIVWCAVFIQYCVMCIQFGGLP
jgi:hypothetical protein